VKYEHLIRRLKLGEPVSSRDIREAVADAIEKTGTTPTDDDDDPEDELDQTVFGFARLDRPTAKPHR